MLLVLLLTFSISNIALAFYTTLVFRRDRALLLARQGKPLPQPPWTDDGEDDGFDAGPRLAEEGLAESESEDSLPEDSDLPSSEPADLEAPAEADETQQDAESASPGAEPPTPKLPPSPKLEVPPIDPAEQHPLEELFYRAARLVEDLSQIDHFVLACQADEQASDEKLAALWPGLAEKATPIESNLPRVVSPAENPELAEDHARLHETGRAIVEHCRSLTDEMDSAQKREHNSESGIHHLRDLFVKACEFRDQCEDLLVTQLKRDHQLYAVGGRLAWQQQADKVLARGEGLPVAAMGLEVDALRELNSLHGAEAVNRLLEELPRIISDQLPECQLISRYHGQSYLMLVPGDGESVAEAADRLRQRVASTSFRVENQQLEATVSVVVFPLLAEATDLLARITAGQAAAKDRGPNGVLLYREEQWQSQAATEQELVKREVVLQNG